MNAASASGCTAAMRAAASVQARPSCAISTLETGGAVHWFSSAPPAKSTVSPETGSRNVARARPSQNRFGAYAALMNDGACRVVTCTPRPNTAASSYAPPASVSTTPGEPVMSSAVPSVPSGPGAVASARPLTERGSEPPVSARWQGPQATARDEESCSSQNNAFPKFTLAGVSGLPGGTGGGGSGWSGGGGGGSWASAKTGARRGPKRRRGGPKAAGHRGGP